MKSILTLTILLSLTACTTTQKIKLWEAIEEATRDDALKPPPPVVVPTPEPEVKPPPAPKPKEYSRLIKGFGDGSLWKPISESDKRAVFLMPSNTKGEFVRAEARRGGTILDPAPFAGDTHNGNRPHWRLPKTGATYGNDFIMRGYRADGSFRDWHIPEGAARVE